MNKIIFVPILILISAGCRFGDRPVFVPAEGLILFEEKPLVGATISFVPVDVSGRPGTAMSDTAGRFRMGTLKPGDGLIPGEYVLTVSKIEVLYMPTEEESEAHFEKTGRYLEPKFKRIVPDRFESEETSTLRYTIPAKGDRNIVVRFSGNDG